MKLPLAKNVRTGNIDMGLDLQKNNLEMNKASAIAL
jgi:hypothetical protein